jgi:hypothetical protein
MLQGTAPEPALQSAASASRVKLSAGVKKLLKEQGWLAVSGTTTHGVQLLCVVLKQCCCAQSTVLPLLWADFAAHGTLHQLMSTAQRLQWFTQQPLIRAHLEKHKISDEDVQTWYVVFAYADAFSLPQVHHLPRNFRWGLTGSELEDGFPRDVGADWFNGQVASAHSKKAQGPLVRCHGALCCSSPVGNALMRPT